MRRDITESVVYMKLMAFDLLQGSAIQFDREKFGSDNRDCRRFHPARRGFKKTVTLCELVFLVQHMLAVLLLSSLAN